MKIVMARVDERLVHGQILNDWFFHSNPTHILIADDLLVTDEFMSNIYKALLPIWLNVKILSVEDMAVYLKGDNDQNARAFLLGKTPVTFQRLKEAGIDFPVLTLADKEYFPNKVEIAESKKKAINWLLSAGVRVVAQNSPEEEAINIIEY